MKGSRRSPISMSIHKKVAVVVVSSPARIPSKIMTTTTTITRTLNRPIFVNSFECTTFLFLCLFIVVYTPKVPSSSFHCENHFATSSLRRICDSLILNICIFFNPSPSTRPAHLLLSHTLE